MAYQYHPHIYNAAADGGVLGDHRHQIYTQPITDFHMISFPAHYAAAHGRAQPPIQPSLFLSEETTVFYNYPSYFAAIHGGTQPPQALAPHPTFQNSPANSAAIRGASGQPPYETMLRLQENTPAHFRAAYDGGVAVLDAFPVPMAAYRANSMAAPPQRDDGLPEEVVARFLKTMTCEKATAAGGGDGEVCAVCLDDLCWKNPTVVVLRCRHRFHGGCIGKWLQTKNVCPLCKAIAIDIL